MRRSARLPLAGRITLAGCVTIAAASCNAITGLDKYNEGPPGGSDATASGSGGGMDSALGDAPGDQAAGDASDAADGPSASDASDAADAPVTTCSGSVVYVSAMNGDDANAGCDSTKPKKSIGSGLATAKASGIALVEVCKGTYSETNLTIDFGVSLKGGWNCASWKRTSSYGYPTFDGTNEVVVQNADVTKSPNTLAVGGMGVGATSVIDGLTLQGATTGTVPTATTALYVEGSASPVISNDKILGGSVGAHGSMGAWITSSATPSIQGNILDGGSGKSNVGTGSIALFADGTNGSLTISSNAMNGGSGSGTGNYAGSAGMVLNSTIAGLSYVVKNNTVNGGTGNTTGSAIATYGVYGKGSGSYTIQSNAVDGGVSLTGTLCPYAVELQTTGAVSITSNRLWGGKCNVAAPGANAGLYGVNITGGPSSTSIVNNMIHMGTTTASIGAGALNLYGTVANAVIRHNTLIAGSSPQQVEAVFLEGAGVTGTVIENNVMALANATGRDVYIDCPADAGPAQLQSFRNNLLVGAMPAPYILLGFGKNCGLPGAHSVDDLTADLMMVDPGVMVGGNLTMAASCTTDAGTDSGCIVTPSCSTQAGCFQTLFSSWDQASLGYANLFPTGSFFAGSCPPTAPGNDGWPLSAMAPCKAVRSSLDDNATVATDLYGNCRSSGTPSMGAAESPADRVDAGGGCL